MDQHRPQSSGAGARRDRNSDQVERTFDPQTSTNHKRVPADRLVIYNTSSHVQQLQEKEPDDDTIRIDRNSVVLSIAGIRREHGIEDAGTEAQVDAAWSVYLGPDSKYNERGLLDPEVEQSQFKTELVALSQALDVVDSRIFVQDFKLCNYYIRTDSQDLYTLFTEQIEVWIANEGIAAQPDLPKDYAFMKKIRDDMVAFGQHAGMRFRFWHVPREENIEACHNAEMAFPPVPEAGQILDGHPPPLQ